MYKLFINNIYINEIKYIYIYIYIFKYINILILYIITIIYLQKKD